MRILAAICILACSVSAQVGQSGIVYKDRPNVQFSHELANLIAVAGPAGLVLKDGRNIQLGADGSFDHNLLSVAPAPAPAPAPLLKAAPLPQLIKTGALVGAAGVVNPDGVNYQFTQDQADNIILAGPSGIVTKDGNNIQFRQKRSIGYVSPLGNVGTSGILRADGTTTLFDHDTAHSIVLAGPSGIVTNNGNNIQLTSDLNIASPSAHAVQPQYNAADIILDGPSGTIYRDGRLVQKRAKRSAPIVQGPSGMILEDGTQIQFKTAGAYIVLDGPGGIVMSDGTLIQKRAKRAAPLLRGPSGMILSDGTPVQFKSEGAYVILDGPSGMILSDGTLVQKTA